MHPDKVVYHQLAATILSGMLSEGYAGSPEVAAQFAWDYTEALINERNRRIDAAIERSRQQERDRYKAEQSQDPDD